MARTDELIKKDVIDQLTRDDRVDSSQVSVEVRNGVVTLRGEVPTYFSRLAAYDDAEAILGVTSVRNQLLVNLPSTAAIPTDVDIENSVRQRLAINPDIDLLDLEVVVSAGRVTLRGTVDAYWKKIHAEDLIAGEPGVVWIENHLAVVPSEDVADRAIADDIVETLESKAAVDADDVNVRVRDGDVTLTGSVSTWTGRKAADEAAFYTPGVTHVNNRISVMAI